MNTPQHRGLAGPSGAEAADAEVAGPARPAAVAWVLNQQAVQACAGETILQAAQRLGVEIPHLCWTPGLKPAGNCRACMVEVAGERTLTAACCRPVTPGLQVHSHSLRARQAQKLVLELLQSDLQAPTQTAPGLQALPPDEVHTWATRLGLGSPRFAARLALPPDRSHPAIAVNLAACIQCTRCLRACRDEQANDVIGLAGRGAEARIVFDLGDPLGASSCVGCGECVQACPTGALSPVLEASPAAQMPPAPVAACSAQADRPVDSLCPFCGVGCQVRYHVQEDRIRWVDGRDGPANQGRLCVKGRYGFDYVRHPQRLTVPLVRRADAPKRPELCEDPVAARAAFREASWGEALARAGEGLRRLRDQHGGDALAGFGSAKGSNEEAYLFQKLVRLGLATQNVDHCTRLCHASSVAALLEGLGSAAVSNPVRDVMQAEVVLLIGANPAANHPVAASWMKNAARQGARLILLDPRGGELVRHAHRHLAFHPGTDVPLLKSMMHVIHAEGLVDADFIAQRTEGFEAWAATLQDCSPERLEPVTGIAPEMLREVARLYARSRASMIFWGMGVSQHVHGTDNARCLIALALMTGQIGRPGTGLHPLRGQNNVQGASDAGLIPMRYPDYAPVSDRDARQRVATAWQVPEDRLSLQPGLTVVEVVKAAATGQIKGMLVMGENPAMSDPDLQAARAALARLDHLVVQDIFLTETAALADVVLPASAFTEKTGSFTNTDRLVQLGRRALGLPGQARQDLWILTALAQQLGLDWSALGATPQDCDAATARVFEEMRNLMPSLAGLSWERLQRQGAQVYPCTSEADPGQPVLFARQFPTPNGRGRFVPVGSGRPHELPDADYPLVLITGRHLEHWHTGSMTRRSRVLQALEPEAVALLHPQVLSRHGLRTGDRITLQTRRGQVSLLARADAGMPQGGVFVAFCWFEAAANQLTHAALDPVARIPEFKHCAVRLRPA